MKRAEVSLEFGCTQHVVKATMGSEGALCFHNRTDRDGEKCDGFVVSHAPTGRRVASFDKLAEAKLFVEKAELWPEWLGSHPEKEVDPEWVWHLADECRFTVAEEAAKKKAERQAAKASAE